MTMLGEMTLEEAARQAAGNWKEFTCFCWHRAADLEDADQWAVLYTHHRDSGLLDQSNTEAIRKALEPFMEDTDDADVVMESHFHWAVGHIDGMSIRVYRNGEITEAFKAYHELAERLDDYPVLNEEDYSRREYDATLENIADAAWRLKHEYDLPEGWASEVFSWFWENNQHAVENRDDAGGYPKEEELAASFQALGYQRVEG